MKFGDGCCGDLLCHYTVVINCATGGNTAVGTAFNLLHKHRDKSVCLCILFFFVITIPPLANQNEVHKPQEVREHILGTPALRHTLMPSRFFTYDATLY